MKIVIASDSFKGSLSTLEVAGAVERGILQVFPQAQILKIPVADGGEGLLEAVFAAKGGRFVEMEACGPMGDSVAARFLMLQNGTAVLEMAQASGLPLVPKEQRDPRLATTYGTGQMILRALDLGAEKLVIGIGGSATNDGGAGMAQALGASLLDGDGQELPLGGGALARLARVELAGLDSRLGRLEVVAACDISNSLCGEKGATAVYGPQKGATPAMVLELDRALSVYADCIARDLKSDFRDNPGAGAAGGLGFGLMAFCGAKLTPGIELVLDMAGMDEALRGADLCITGEGRVDFQSAFGKAPDGIARRAKKLGVPVAILAGSLGEGAEELYKRGVCAMSAIQPRPMTLEACLADTPALLTAAADRMMRTIKLGMALGENRRA